MNTEWWIECDEFSVMYSWQWNQLYILLTEINIDTEWWIERDEFTEVKLRNSNQVGVVRKQMWAAVVIVAVVAVVSVV